MESISSGQAELKAGGRMCCSGPAGCGCQVLLVRGRGGRAWPGAEGHDSGYKPDQFICVWDFSREEGTWGQRGHPSPAELQLQRLPLVLGMAL